MSAKPRGDRPRVTPTAFEFWQGRSSRLHDRLRYERSVDGWTIERLQP